MKFIMTNGSIFLCIVFGCFFLADFVISLPYKEQKAKPRFTDQVDYSKVWEGIYNPTNIAIHNGQRLVNFVAGTAGWYLVSLFYTATNNGRSATKSPTDYLPSISSYFKDDASDFGGYKTFGKRDTINTLKRMEKVADYGISEKYISEGYGKDALMFDPKTKLAKMIRSFADVVESLGQYDEL